jgi:hypothetical protein
MASLLAVINLLGFLTICGCAGMAVKELLA